MFQENSGMNHVEQQQLEGYLETHGQSLTNSICTHKSASGCRRFVSENIIIILQYCSFYLYGAVDGTYKIDAP